MTFAVLASGLVIAGINYRETRSLVTELHREKGRLAALRIEHYLRTVEGHMRVVQLAPLAPESLEGRHLELVRLLRASSGVVEAAWVDAAGTERMRLSRIVPDVLDGTRDRTLDPLIAAARRGDAAYGPVYFRQQTEPYLTMAVGGLAAGSGVVVGEINLKFVWDVVSAIRVGATGFAYVVDDQGRLVSHPDISLVLRQTDLSALPQVRAATAPNARGGDSVLVSHQGPDGSRRAFLVAWTPVPATGWHVFVEQPVAEAFAPLYASVVRAGLVLVAALVVCVAVGGALARRMTAPIRALQAGAARIGEGRLDERVTVTTGDELESLARDFNTMAARLLEARSGLERRIEDRTRALAQANAAKSRFLAVASHDLRQPVHAMGLYVAQAMQARDEAARHSLLGRIESSWQSISGLLDALLDISRLDARNVPVHRVIFEAQWVLDRIERSFAVLADAKGLRMRVRPSRLLLESDPAHLERILLNLVSNALRFTQDGGVLVGVRRSGAGARIEVWDTGGGMTPEDIAHVFDEFYRGRSAGDDSAGLGLGLAIVRRLAQHIDAHVTLRSRPGTGSMFAVHVSLAPAGSRADAPVPRVALPALRSGGVALVIDDDAQAREAAAGLLSQWGWTTASAGSGDEAFAAIAGGTCRPDVIVCDYHLAEENGVDVVDRIRRACARTVPAVLVSGDVTDELRARAAGLSLHLLAKPVQAAKLRAMLHHLGNPDAA